MKFLFKNTDKLMVAHIIYDEESYSFDAQESEKNKDFTSYLINDLNLAVNQQGVIVSVWGFSPHTQWIEKDIHPNKPTLGIIRIENESELTPGISKRINSSERWKVYVNNSRSWICIGDPDAQGKFILFGKNLLANILNQEL